VGKNKPKEPAVHFAFETNTLLVVGVTLLAGVSPGPDFAVVLRNALRSGQCSDLGSGQCSGRKSGRFTALGIACGVMVHVGYTLLGLGWLVARHAWLLTAVRYLGAAYLVWLGVSAFLPRRARGAEAPRPGHAKDEACVAMDEDCAARGGVCVATGEACVGRSEACTATPTSGSPTAAEAFRNGFLCNVLNPKTVMFFLALFTQVVAPGTGIPAQLAIGAFVVLAHLGWFWFVATAVTSPASLRVFRRWRRTMERVTGGFLVGLGLTLAAE
jgi:threonine/homoserine/homoserine lactone efflux protein